MPLVEGGEHIINIFNVLGPATPNSPGMIPLTYSEVKSWVELTNANLHPWEPEAIVTMSRVFVSQLIRSSSKKEPPPYYRDDRSLEERRQQVMDSFKNTMFPKKKVKKA